LTKRKFLIGGIILFLALGFLGYSGFTHSVSYYYEVSELLEQGSSIYDQNVRVNGKVVPGSIEQQFGSLTVSFTLADITEDASLPVVYRGPVPDNFRAGSEVVVEGRYTDGGIFEADNIMTKCASKYTPAS